MLELLTVVSAPVHNFLSIVVIYIQTASVNRYGISAETTKIEKLTKL